MLLLRHGDFVLLQKRPEKAIWGGLWSLPESAWRAREKSTTHLTAKELLRSVLPEEKVSITLKACESIERGLEIKHIFTHRRLWMQIWSLSMSNAKEFSSSDLKWVPLKQLGKYGLPQPIKLLLQGLSLTRDDGLKN
jgi:A/G-specific adenine glycosylase